MSADDDMKARAREVAGRWFDKHLAEPNLRLSLPDQLSNLLADFARAEVERERKDLAETFDAASRRLAILRSMDATIGARTYEDARNIILARSTK